MELKKIIALYLNFCLEQKTLSPKTTKAYGTDLTQFAEFSAGTFNKNVIIEYISQLHKQFKSKTAKRKIAALKAFTHYLMTQEIIETNPFEKLTNHFASQKFSHPTYHRILSERTSSNEHIS